MIALLRRRWMPVALLASLGINMFLVGFLSGRRPPPWLPPGPPPGPERLIEEISAVLPPDDAALLRRTLDANRDRMAADRNRRMAFRDRVEDALRAEPFDPAALEAVFDEEDERERQSWAGFRKILIETAGAMSAEGRRRMAMFRPGPGGPPPGHPPGPPLGPPPGP